MNHGGETIAYIWQSTFWHTNANTKDVQPDVIEISVVLINLEMQVMDGTTCTKEIRDAAPGRDRYP